MQKRHGQWTPSDVTCGGGGSFVICDSVASNRFPMILMWEGGLTVKNFSVFHSKFEFL